MIVVLKGADFSAKNIGRINVPSAELESVSIAGPSSVSGMTASYTAAAAFSDGTSGNITSAATWSVTSGSNYASIDNGVLTINQSASSSQVTLMVSYTNGGITKTASKDIVVTYDLGLDDFTTAAITASGNASMTNAQKLALDSFFGTLGAYGTASNIWSKLDKVYLPFICSTLAKSCVNYKTNNTDATPDSTWLELRSKGIGRISGSTEGTQLILDDSYVWNWNNKSAFIMNAEEFTSAHTKWIGFINFLSGTTFETAQMMNYNGSGICYHAYWCANSKAINNTTAGYDKFMNILTPSCRGISCDGTHYIVTEDEGSNIYDVPEFLAEYANSTAKKLKLAQAANGTISDGESPAFAAGILGDYLTQSEFDTVVSALNTLWTAFNA